MKMMGIVALSDFSMNLEWEGIARSLLARGPRPSPQQALALKGPATTVYLQQTVELSCAAVLCRYVLWYSAWSTMCAVP